MQLFPSVTQNLFLALGLSFFGQSWTPVWMESQNFWDQWGLCLDNEHSCCFSEFPEWCCHDQACIPLDSLICFYYRRKCLNFERLETQLKACHCRIMFSKAKVNILKVQRKLNSWNLTKQCLKTSLSPALCLGTVYYGTRDRRTKTAGVDGGVGISTVTFQGMYR